MYKTFSFYDRLNESRRVSIKYPDRIPIICERSPTSDGPIVAKKKYLVPHNFTIGQFLSVLRKRMKLPPEKAIFLFINTTIYHSSYLLSNIYEMNKDADGFLYITYAYENTFGCRV
jgi:GABA(A) receptor-associated protein